MLCTIKWLDDYDWEWENSFDSTDAANAFCHKMLKKNAEAGDPKWTQPISVQYLDGATYESNDWLDLAKAITKWR